MKFLNFDCGTSTSKINDEREEGWALQRAERGFDDTETWSLDYSFSKYLSFSMPFTTGPSENICELIKLYKDEETLNKELEYEFICRCLNELKNSYIPSLNHSWLVDASFYLQSRLPRFWECQSQIIFNNKMHYDGKTEKKHMLNKVRIKRIISNLNKADKRNQKTAQYLREKSVHEFLKNMQSFWW